MTDASRRLSTSRRTVLRAGLGAAAASAPRHARPAGGRACGEDQHAALLVLFTVLKVKGTLAERLAPPARAVLHLFTSVIEPMTAGAVDIHADVADAVPIFTQAAGAPLTFTPATADQGVLADGLRGHPAAVFDTSWMNMMDTMALFARVPAERIVFGSDPPYGRTFVGLYLVLRMLACLGVDTETRRAVVGGTVTRMVAGEPLAPTTAPRAPQQILLDAKLARLHANLMLVLGIMFTGTAERALDMLWLSQMACRDANAGAAGAALERISPLLEHSQRFLEQHPDSPRGAGAPLVLAMAIAATEVPQTV